MPHLMIESWIVIGILFVGALLGLIWLIGCLPPRK